MLFYTILFVSSVSMHIVHGQLSTIWYERMDIDPVTPTPWTLISGTLPKAVTNDKQGNCPIQKSYCWRFHSSSTTTSIIIRNASTQAFDSVQLSYNMAGDDVIDEDLCSIKYSIDSSNFITIASVKHYVNSQLQEGLYRYFSGTKVLSSSSTSSIIIEISYVGSGARCWFNEFTLAGKNPTEAPTRVPTPPSVPPSKNPTETPITDAPSSANQTETPSTANPSAFPSKNPTEITTAPTANPLVPPSNNPTETPKTDAPSPVTTAPTANPSVPPSANQTEIPSTANPSVPPSNNPTIITHVSLPPSSESVLTTAKAIVYTVSIRLTASCEEAICDVISEELEEQILNAFNQEVELMSMAIINGEAVLRLSAETDANAQLDADYIKSHIEREIEDDDRFGDVSVHSTEEDEEEDDPSVTMKWKPKLWVTAISTVLIAICSVFCIYLCLRKRRKMKAMKATKYAVENIASNDANQRQPSNADAYEDDNKQESNDESVGDVESLYDAPAGDDKQESNDESVGDGESLYDAPAGDDGTHGRDTKRKLSNEGEAEREIDDCESLYDAGDANTTKGTTNGPTLTGGDL